MKLTEHPVKNFPYFLAQKRYTKMIITLTLFEPSDIHLFFILNSRRYTFKLPITFFLQIYSQWTMDARLIHDNGIENTH